MPANNSLHLIGNLGDDPRVHTSHSGNEFVTFSVATNRFWKDDKGNKQTATEWHDCVVYGPRAQVVKNYVKKGSSLAISGELRYNSYTKNDITIRKAIVVVNDFQFVGNRSSADHAQTQSAPQQEQTKPQTAQTVAPAAAAATTTDNSFAGVDKEMAAALGKNEFVNSSTIEDLDIPF